MSPKQSRASARRPDAALAARFLSRNCFITCVLLAAIVLYTILFSTEAATPDGSNYMLAGKQMLQGQYGFTFLHRLPLLPLMFALLYLCGLSIVQIGFIVPLFFVMLSLIATYLLAREISGESAARLTTVLLFCFPEFWRWGTKFLTDIPVLSLSALSMYFFIKGLKNRKHFYYMGICIAAGALLKLSFLIIPFVAVTYLAAYRRKVLITKEFAASIVIPAAVFLVAFLAISSARQADDFMLLRSLAQTSSGGGERLTALMQLLTGEYGDILYFMNFALFPLFVFLPLGIVHHFKRKDIFLLYCLTAIFLFIFTFSVVRLRYYSPLFHIFALLSCSGFLYSFKSMKAIKKSKTRILSVKVLFAALLVASFVNTIYLSSLDFGMQWGATRMSSIVSGMDGLVLSDYLPYHLNMSADLVTNTTVIESFFEGGGIPESALDGMGVKYVIISIYSEFGRSPSNDTYHPSFGPFEIPFIERPYTGDRVPPEYTFRSDTYRRLESSPYLRKIQEVYRGSQKTFIIYAVS